jgi:hypothetical protein
MKLAGSFTCKIPNPKSRRLLKFFNNNTNQIAKAMPEASSDNRQPIPGLIYWAASLVSDKKPDNASSATSTTLDQQIPGPFNGSSSISEPTGDDEDPLNYDVLSYPGIMAKKLVGKTVMEQFVHPAYVCFLQFLQLPSLIALILV